MIDFRLIFAGRGRQSVLRGTARRHEALVSVIFIDPWRDAVQRNSWQENSEFSQNLQRPFAYLHGKSSSVTFKSLKFQFFCDALPSI
jgi:hypothetical protein